MKFKWRRVNIRFNKEKYPLPKEAIEALKKYSKNYVWVNENFEGLLKEYLGRWIAVENCKVVDAGDDAVELAVKYWSSHGVYIAKITEYEMGHV